MTSYENSGNILEHLNSYETFSEFLRLSQTKQMIFCHSVRYDYLLALINFVAIYEGKRMYNPDEKSKELVWFYIRHYTYIGL